MSPSNTGKNRCFIFSSTVVQSFSSMHRKHFHSSSSKQIKKLFDTFCMHHYFLGSISLMPMFSRLELLRNSHKRRRWGKGAAAPQVAQKSASLGFLGPMGFIIFEILLKKGCLLLFFRKIRNVLAKFTNLVTFYLQSIA